MRSTGRDGRALADWHRGGMEEPKKIDGYYLSQDERLPRDHMPGRLCAVEGPGHPPPQAGHRRAQALVPRPDGDDRGAARRGRGPRRARPLGGRPDHGRGQQVGDRDARGAHDPPRDTAPPAGRARCRAGAGRHNIKRTSYRGSSFSKLCL